MAEFTNIIFDLDGTLAHTAPDIVDALEKAYRGIEKYSYLKVDDSVVGPQIREIILKVTPDISEQNVSLVIDDFRNNYDSSSFPLTTLYPGISELLDLLKLNSYKLYIVTNKPIKATTKVLESLHISKIFEDIVCPNSLERTMNKNEMVRYLMASKGLKNEETLFIGDTIADVNAAHANNIKALAVTYGYGDKKDLMSSRPDLLVNNVSEIFQIIEKIS